MALHEKTFRRLYPNGYVDFAAGRSADVSIAQPVGGLASIDTIQLELGTYRTGLIWDDEIKDYRATASISTSILGR